MAEDEKSVGDLIVRLKELEENVRDLRQDVQRFQRTVVFFGADLAETREKTRKIGYVSRQIVRLLDGVDIFGENMRHAVEIDSLPPMLNELKTLIKEKDR